MPADVAIARVREIDSHLRMWVREGVREEEAVRGLGAAEVVAAEMIRQYKGYSIGSAGKLSRWVGLIVTGSVLTPVIVHVIPTHLPVGLTLGLSTLGEVIAVLAFCGQVWRTRRWLAFPVSAWAVAGIVGALLLCLLLQPSVSQTRDSQWLSLKANRMAMDQWRRGSPPTSYGPFEIHTRNLVHIPLSPISTTHDLTSTFVLVPMPPERAKAAWMSHGGAFAKSLEVNEARLRSEDQVSMTPGLRELPRATVTLIPLVVLVLTVWNAAVLALAFLVSISRNALHRGRI